MGDKIMARKAGEGRDKFRYRVSDIQHRIGRCPTGRVKDKYTDRRG